MTEENNVKKYYKRLRDFFINNIKSIIIIFGVIFVILISLQIYNYVALNDLKKTSVKFFNSIEVGEEVNEALYKLKDKKNIFSILSSLKLIQIYNKENSFTLSTELYKDIILSNEIDELYKSSIATHASYTLINASYLENTLKYFNDINYFIENISDNIESFFSIKKELKYLLLVTEIDLNNLKYSNSQETIEMFNDINNSNKISSSVKERVKKIHDFQIYK